MNPTRCCGFTLIELLVVIAIIGVLLALLLPTLAAVRRRAIDLRCLTHVRSIAQAMLAFEVDHGRLPRHAAEAGDTNLAHAIASPGFDARPQYRDYISVDYLLCPHLPDWQPSQATAANVHSSFVLTPGYFASRADGQWVGSRWVKSAHAWTIDGTAMTVLVMDRLYRWDATNQNIINHTKPGYGFQMLNVDNPINRGMAQVAIDARDLRLVHEANAAFTDGSARLFHGSDPRLIQVPDRDPAKNGSYLMPTQ